MQTPTQAPTITPTLAPVNNNQLKGEDHPRKVGPTTIVSAEPSAIVSAEFTNQVHHTVQVHRLSQSVKPRLNHPLSTNNNQPTKIEMHRPHHSELNEVDPDLGMLLRRRGRKYWTDMPVPTTQQQSTNHNFSTQEKTNQERSVQPTSQTSSQPSSQPVDQDLGMLLRRRALKYNDHKKNIDDIPFSLWKWYAAGRLANLRAKKISGPTCQKSRTPKQNNNQPKPNISGPTFQKSRPQHNNQPTNTLESTYTNRQKMTDDAGSVPIFAPENFWTSTDRQKNK